MRNFLKGFVLPMAIFVAALEALIRIPHDSKWYDVTMITLIVGAIVGAAWCGFKMSRHHREIRVYKQERVEMPHGVWPLVPTPLEPKTLPQWMTKAAEYILPTPKKKG